MASANRLVDDFLGGDPIAGTRALHELVEIGDAGEEALFSKPIAFPKTAQVYRRWLRYVASRESTVVDRLLDRQENPDRFKDAHTAAALFAGTSDSRKVTNFLYPRFERGRLTPRNYYPVTHRFMAWAHAGGSAGALWDYVREDMYAWEKLKVFAFRGACAAAARVDAGDLWAIEELITHRDERSSLKEIDNSPGVSISNDAIEAYELSGEGNRVFMIWRRGDVADKILRSWSQHPHWRVRDFGARILGSLGFERTVPAIIEWLGREPVQLIRDKLLYALEKSETTAGADVILEQDFRSGLARVGWRATDKDRAVEALIAIASQDDDTAVEALVSLARLGRRHPRFTELLSSHEPYRRLNAALALAYAGENSAVHRLVSMQREAATPFERIFLAAALAKLGNPNGGIVLCSELMTAAGAKDSDRRVDTFFLHPYLQTALIDALAASNAGTGDYLDAWRAELEPFEPVAKPVVLAVSEQPIAAAGVPVAVAGQERAESGQPERKHVVFIVHGIRTHAEWATRAVHELELDPSIRAKPLGYGYFDVFRFLSPFDRSRLGPIRRIADMIRAERLNNPDQMSAIAHSFGTYIIVHLFTDTADIFFHRLIFCGSIVPSDYKWEHVRHRIGENRSTDWRLVNDCGMRDIWPIFARWWSSRYGSSGRVGFYHNLVKDRFHKRGHNDFVSPDFIARYWLPYLTRGEITEGELDRPPTPWYLEILTVIRLKHVVLSLLAVVIFWFAVPVLPKVLDAVSKYFQQSTLETLPPTTEAPSPELSPALRRLEAIDDYLAALGTIEAATHARVRMRESQFFGPVNAGKVRLERANWTDRRETLAEAITACEANANDCNSEVLETAAPEPAPRPGKIFDVALHADSDTINLRSSSETVLFVGDEYEHLPLTILVRGEWTARWFEGNERSKCADWIAPFFELISGGIKFRLNADVLNAVTGRPVTRLPDRSGSVVDDVLVLQGWPPNRSLAVSLVDPHGYRDSYICELDPPRILVWQHDRRINSDLDDARHFR
jgi:hypothetical protein